MRDVLDEWLVLIVQRLPDERPEWLSREIHFVASRELLAVSEVIREIRT